MGAAFPTRWCKSGNRTKPGITICSNTIPRTMDLRGCFRADDQGRYYFRGVCPTGYMIPMDGPVGDMIRAQKRHGYRPAHIHFVIGAPGYRELVTALYVAGDAHIDSDTVFGVDESLIISLNKTDRSSPLPDLPSIHYDFRLAAAKDQMTGRVRRRSVADQRKSYRKRGIALTQESSVRETAKSQISWQRGDESPRGPVSRRPLAR